MEEKAIIKDWFNVILDHSPEAIMALRAVRDINENVADLEFLFTNKKALLLMNRISLAGQSLIQEFPGTRKLGVYDKYVDVVETGVSWSGEIYYDADGFSSWTYLSVAKMGDGCIVSFLDINDRKIAEEKLREQTHLIEQVTAMAPDIITVLELPSLNMIYSSRENLALHGFDRDEMMNMSTEERRNLIHPEDKERLGKFFTSFTPDVEDDAIITAEYRARNKAGEWLWFSVRSKIFERNANGVVLSIVNVIQNISERKKNELEIQQLNRQLTTNNRALESANAEIKMFSSLAANDYNDTLRHLYTNLEHIVSNDARNLSDSGRANLRRAQSAIQKLRLLTDDIMSYVQLQQTDEQRQETDLATVIQTVLGSMSAQLQQSNVQCQCNSVFVSGFPSLLRVLFHHLLENAIRFKKEGAEPNIRINCRQLQPGETLALDAAHKNVLYNVVTVSDDGIGFPQDESENIFRVFHRLQDKIKYKGSGTGLAICKKVMHLHDGFIAAESEPGKGATFHCYFPV